MKKKLYKHLCWVLVLLLLLPCIVACRDTEDKGGEGTIQDGAVQDIPQFVTDFTVEMLSEMKIVYSHGVSEDIAKEADKLKDLIKNVYGVELTVTSDYFREGSAIYCELPNEILIGETNRTADDEYYASIRYEDYGYTTAGGKVIIGGGNTQATVKAVIDFSYNIVTLKKGGDTLFFCPDFAVSHQSGYQSSEILLNGVSYLE